MWERAAEGWGSRADRLRRWGMPVSVAMIDGLGLQPGQRVLELAAGPGDTGLHGRRADPSRRDPDLE